MKRSTKLLRQFRKQTFTKCRRLNVCPEFANIQSWQPRHPCSGGFVQFSLSCPFHFARHVLNRFWKHRMIDHSAAPISAATLLLEQRERES